MPFCIFRPYLDFKEAQTNLAKIWDRKSNLDKIKQIILFIELLMSCARLLYQLKLLTESDIKAILYITANYIHNNNDTVLECMYSVQYNWFFAYVSNMPVYQNMMNSFSKDIIIKIK